MRHAASFQAVDNNISTCHSDCINYNITVVKLNTQRYEYEEYIWSDVEEIKWVSGNSVSNIHIIIQYNVSSQTCMACSLELTVSSVEDEVPVNAEILQPTYQWEIVYYISLTAHTTRNTYTLFKPRFALYLFILLSV